jgi:hypothetical protein
MASRILGLATGLNRARFGVRRNNRRAGHDDRAWTRLSGTLERDHRAGNGRLRNVLRGDITAIEPAPCTEHRTDEDLVFDFHQSHPYVRHPKRFRPERSRRDTDQPGLPPVPETINPI